MGGILPCRYGCLLHSGRQIHIGAARLGLHGGRHMGLTASHEPASEPSNRQSFAPLVAEMFQCEGGIREDDPVGGGRGLIHESEAALDHVEAIDPELDGGLIRHLLRHLRGLLSSRSEEHTSELQSRVDLVCRLLLEKKKKKSNKISHFKKKKNIKKTH